MPCQNFFITLQDKEEWESGDTSKVMTTLNIQKWTMQDVQDLFIFALLGIGEENVANC